MNTLIPDGATRTYIFDFDAAATDLNSDPQIGQYQGVITGQFDFPMVGSSVSLSFSQVRPFTTGDAFQLPDALSPLSGELALDSLPASLFSTDASFPRVTYTLDDILLVEGEVTAPTPTGVNVSLPVWLFTVLSLLFSLIAKANFSTLPKPAVDQES